MPPRLRRLKGGSPPRHLARNTLHRASADTTLFGDRKHALLGSQLSLDSLFNGGAYFGPSELLARFYGPLKSGADSLADHAALELGKSGDIHRYVRDIYCG
jgi:hypothetical protein